MIHFAIPGDLTAPTGGYGYAREVLAAWARAGISAEVVELSGEFPAPSEAALAEALAALAPLDQPLLIDGLAYGAFSETLAARLGPKATVLLHHPLCDETGLSDEDAASLFQRERAALAHARAVIVTSPNTEREVVARFGVPQNKITTALPGLEKAERAALDGDPPMILAVGSLTPRKGYADLIEALKSVQEIGWQCRIFGSPEHDPNEAARLLQQIRQAGLDERITLEGSAAHSTVSAAYGGSDLFITTSYHEGYGMAVAEAAAHGLPIIATRGGALAETMPPACLVPVGDVSAISEALRMLLLDRTRREAVGTACHTHARTLPDWDESARIISDVLGATA